MRRVALGVGVMSAAALSGWALVGGLMPGGLTPVRAQDAASKPAFYTEKVLPILQTNCGQCHLAMNHKGGLSMATKASFMKGGRDGVVIVPGDPANSLLVKLMRHEGPADDPMPMPPSRPKISDADIAVVTAWVKAGAPMPDVPQ